ncbi:N-acetyl-gamma-glutamyl-phosphate reductase [Mannheimia sp. AT1]|uniref:N-acetyl-gamma-glutamyl-phosphate reductase n=1 Tax=Mannheimia cairinae TaxID=3025936 RepID=A0ABT5MRP9_9PAST|nr:N-acetyl-gamma-glutamyl-phosphate reductase [Mannheimia cairinae]MDD0823523.1 N-acetyl-gamma-glutamyl-phosphate reductase [Mannheimia cairinae]MDD0826736.1 N-acetyl-gamma-glutamyl-phosphate reductase [Mannheimia cairinae]
MSKYKIFVDGAVGTTGLRIHERLNKADDIELLTLPEELRKDLNARIAKVAEADLTFLCLPDEASKELVANAPQNARICDTSTAHRVNPDWIYGFAELSEQREKIKNANRVAVPGCHATGYIALVRPLVEKGILPTDYPLSCHSLTGYSGGGKAMIAEYENAERPEALNAPRVYGLALKHKHLPEMQALTLMQKPPIFTPVVADYYSGMLVTVPVPISALQAVKSGEEIANLLNEYYQGSPLISVHPFQTLPEDGMLSANAYAGKDSLEIFVYGNENQILLAARFDNLGKGASGAAVQCMNIMLGREETSGLEI